MKRSYNGFLLIAITVGLSSCGFAVVGPGERGVKVNMGVMDKTVLPPGPQFYNPLTENIHQYSLKQETVEGQCGPLTADQQPITISYKVLYKVPENKVTDLFSKYNGDPYHSLVDPQIQEAFRQVVSQYKADQATKNVDQIKNAILAQVQKNMDGLVQVTDIPITHIELPKILQDAIATKQVAEQTALQKQYELDKAKKEAEITVVGAEAQAKSQLAVAEAEAKAIRVKSEALAQSPQLVEYTKAQRWDGALPQIVSGSGGMGAFLNFDVRKRAVQTEESK